MSNIDKHLLGVGLEVLGIVGIALGVKYDDFFYLIGISSGVYTAGRKLRDEELEKRITSKKKNELTDKL